MKGSVWVSRFHPYTINVVNEMLSLGVIGLLSSR